MKLFNTKITLLAVLLSVISLWSCSDDLQPASEQVSLQDVPAEIQADFSRSYPEATDIAWTVSEEYAVASFLPAAVRVESAQRLAVWYRLSDKQKKMHSAPLSFTDLPSAVTEAFYAGEYGALTPCGHAHVITRYHDGNEDYIYVIKAKGALDGTVSTAVKLYYTADGVLVKLSTEIVYDESFGEDEDPDEFKEWLPQTPADFVKAYVDIYYPGARYLHIYGNRDFTRVKILDGHVVRSLLFDASGTWTETATEIGNRDIPEEILAAFRASEYAGWHISKIVEYITASDGHYYLLSLEKGKDKAELRIDADGTVADDPEIPSEPVNPGNPSDGSTYLAKNEIEGFILAKYPGASVIKSDFDEDEAEVEIIYNNHKIKVEFELHTQGYLWSQSEWDFNLRDTASLPDAILKTITDRYAGYQLEYLSYVESAGSAPYYEAGLKSSGLKKTIKVKIDEQGNVIAEYGNH